MAFRAYKNQLKPFSNFGVETFVCDGMEAGQQVTLNLAGANGADPEMVIHEVVTAPTDRSPVSLFRVSNDTSANTLTLRFDTVTNGSLDGAAVKLMVFYSDRASGGIS